MPTAATRIFSLHQTGSSKPRLMPVAAGQALYKGDLVKLDGSGYVVLAATAGSKPGTEKLALIDQDSVNKQSGVLVQVMIVNDDATLRLGLTSAGTATPFAQTQCGVGYEVRNIAVNGISAWFVDVAATTNAKVEVIGPDPGTPTGDAWGACLCRPIAGQWLK
jgi:hypothetical protein